VLLPALLPTPGLHYSTLHSEGRDRIELDAVHAGANPEINPHTGPTMADATNRLKIMGRMESDADQ